MDQRSVEKRLTIAYSILAALGATASITCGIAWGHWKKTFDQCIERNCSCVLYGVHTPTHFLGGDSSSCIWVTFGPLFYILFCIGIGGFHGFRVLFTTKDQVTRTITTKNEAGQTVQVRAVHTEPTNLLPNTYWIIISGFTVFFTVYTLVHFWIYIDGYLSTCKQYRLTLEKLIGAHGTILPVLHGRLACTAVFDFMDYIQPDSGNAYRDGFINTGADLVIGIIAAFFSWLLFLYASVYNIKFARNRN